MSRHVGASELPYPPPIPAAPEVEPALPELVIEKGGPWPGVNVDELWAYRGLFFFLVWRDIKVRYAQTVLGAGWAVIQPLLTMGVFTVIFGELARLPSDGVPYPVFSLAALVPWTYFAGALTGASGSLVSSANLITKVYFPRLVIPLAPVLAGLVDFAIALVLLAAAMVFYGIAPHPLAIVMVPFLVLTMMLTAAGIGFWLSALNIQYRDVKYVIPFLVQVWMYVSPIVYSASQVPERFRFLYFLNPMAGVIEGFRAYLLRTDSLPAMALWMAPLTAIVLFVTGALYFRRTERVFADVA